jgi:hypothetical protein
MSDMFLAGVGCRPGSSERDRILAYCSAPEYGDYEHGALFYGLEAEMLENLRRADVVLLGDSEMMMAFSEDNVGRFFAQRGIRHFLLGFGYGEASGFALALMKKHSLAPKVLIVNANPFFHGFLSEPATQVMNVDALTRARYEARRWFQRAYPLFCRHTPIACGQTHASIYRSKTDGRWIWHGTLASPLLARPIVQPVPAPDLSLLEEQARIGEEFLATLALDRRCVILTGAPSPRVDTAQLATALAARLGTASGTADTGNLATIDNAHLNADSAARWSAEVLGRMDGVLAECLPGRR